MGFVYALIAAGLSLIFGLMEIVNFAHGEFLMGAMFATFWAWALLKLDPLVSLPFTVLLLATSQDRQAAMLMGIDTQRMFALGWAIGAGCVGAAGALLAMFFYIFPDVGATFALLAYVAVALGGFGNVPATLLAGVIVGIV